MNETIRASSGWPVYFLRATREAATLLTFAAGRAERWHAWRYPQNEERSKLERIWISTVSPGRTKIGSVVHVRPASKLISMRRLPAKSHGMANSASSFPPTVPSRLRTPVSLMAVRVAS